MGVYLTRSVGYYKRRFLRLTETVFNSLSMPILSKKVEISLKQILTQSTFVRYNKRVVILTQSEIIATTYLKNLDKFKCLWYHPFKMRYMIQCIYQVNNTNKCEMQPNLLYNFTKFVKNHQKSLFYKKFEYILLHRG